MSVPTTTSPSGAGGFAYLRESMWWLGMITSKQRDVELGRLGRRGGEEEEEDAVLGNLVVSSKDKSCCC